MYWMETMSTAGLFHSGLSQECGHQLQRARSRRVPQKPQCPHTSLLPQTILKYKMMLFHPLAAHRGKLCVEPLSSQGLKCC